MSPDESENSEEINEDDECVGMVYRSEFPSGPIEDPEDPVEDLREAFS
jgi:hypothetical protein